MKGGGRGEEGAVLVKGEAVMGADGAVGEVEEFEVLEDLGE